MGPAAGNAFLDENATKEGVATLSSGLQYKVVAEGSGKSPGTSDNVTVRYRDTLLDGSEFGSPDRRGTTAIYRVDFDGDGKTDVAAWRSATSTWYVLQSSNGAVQATRGGANPPTLRSGAGNASPSDGNAKRGRLRETQPVPLFQARVALSTTR